MQRINMLEAIKGLFKKKAKESRIKRCILVVDDGEVERKVMSKILENEGHDVLCAENGEEAFKICQELLPDMIFLDIGLPDIQGTTVSRRLQMSERTQNIPIVFMTGKDSPTNVINSFDFGAENYLAKPIDAKILIKQVDQLLG